MSELVKTFVLDPEVEKAVRESTDPVVIGTRDTVLFPNYEAGNKAETDLAAVAEARAKSGKALDESDVDEAVAYRKIVSRKQEAFEKIEAEAKAAANAVWEQYKEQTEKMQEAVSSARKVALSALSESAGADIDTEEAATAFTVAIASVEGIAALYKSRGIDLGFRKRSADSVTRAKGGSNGGRQTGIKRVRWESLSVNGEPVKNLTEAAKAIGLSQQEASDNFLLKRFQADHGDLVGGTEYTATVTHKDKTWTLVGTPKSRDENSDETE
jgi:hypothetical protein